MQPPGLTYVGAPIPRTEGWDKVTGRTVFAADVRLPGTLIGKILRSPHPHARVVRIDASAARAIPGVHAVVTGADLAGRLWGKVLRDMPVLCWDRVRFVGDRVAAVAAETEAAAEAALDAIVVEYEELPAVFDPLDALDPSAPLLHEDITRYEGGLPERLATDLHNGSTRLAWSKGDVDRGFADADLVLEHSFRIPSRHQGYLEPHSVLVHIDEQDRVQVWAASKAPFRVRTQLSKAAGVPEERILVNVTSVGGDFGGKGEAMDVPIAYFLAKEAGRPVRITMSFGEELTAANPSHPTVVTIKSGVKRDGAITARVMRMYHACGAYAALKPNGVLSSYHYVGSAYRVPNAEFEFIQVYTNTTPGGYFRAPGAHQYTFALESHTDLLARELGMDVVEFRLKNLISEGEDDAVGNHMVNIKAREVLEAALNAAAWDAPKPAGVGRGIGLFGRQIGGGPGGSIMAVEPNGAITVLSSTFDMGAGTHTVMRQLAATEMEVPLDQVRVVVGDTDTAIYDDGPRASRVTYTEGQAVLDACRQLRDRLTAHAAQLLDCQESEVQYEAGTFRVNGQRLSLAEVATSLGGGRPISVTAQLEFEQVHDVMYFVAQVAEVGVDAESGQLHLRRLVTAHDVGTIINPVTHQGQIDGGVATGVGLALTEEILLEDGRVANANLGAYKLPTIADVPELETVLLPSAGGTGPYEAKAIGELANNATPAAVANAVADAVGARVFELPVTAERVLAALESPQVDRR